MSTCLIVDDSKVVRKLVKSIVENLSFEAMEAGDGQEAIEKCKENMPDVILLDWNMPVLDGMGFLKAFKAEFSDAKAVIIFCTTENEVGRIQEAIAAGAHEYVMKPFDGEIIKNKFIQTGVLSG